MTTPAHQLPTIKEGSTMGFRFNVGTWCGIGATCIAGIVTLIGFVRWLDAMYADVQALKKQGEALERIEATVREIEFRQKYGITAGLPAPMKANP